MPLNSIYNVSLLYEIPGKQGSIGLYVKQSIPSPGVPALDSEACWNACAVNLANTLAAQLPDTLTFLGAYVVEQIEGTPQTYPYLGMFATPIPGGLTSTDNLPEGQGPLVLLGPGSLSVGARRQINRVYLPVMREADQVDGAIATTLVTIIENAWDGIIGEDGVNVGWMLVTYSPAQAAIAGTADWEVNTIRVSDQIARVVRRRPRYQGRS